MPSMMFGIPPDSEQATNYDEELLYRRAQQQMERIARAHEEVAEEKYYRKLAAPSSQTITMRMPTGLLNRLDAMAEEDATSRSHVLRQITSFFLNNIYDNPITENSIMQDTPLYNLAVNIVVKQQCASISLIQRHLRIGYAMAQRLMKELEVGGVVTPPDRNGERFVVVQQSAWHSTTSAPEA